MKFEKKLMVVGGLTFICGAVLSLQGCAVKPEEFITENPVYTSISDEIEVTGIVHGEKSVTYYAEVSAPIEMFDIEVGDTVENGEKIVEFDTRDLENSLTNAELTAEYSQSSADGEVKASNKRAAIYNQANSDIEAYKYLYAFARAGSDKLDTDQYAENWDIAQVEKCIRASIADKTGEISKKQADINAEDHTKEEVQDIYKDIEKLQGDIAGLNKDLANLPTAKMSPDEYRKFVAESNWMEDITRNWTQAQTQANQFEGQILNSSQKDSLMKNVEVAQLSVDIAADNLATAMAGVTSDMKGIVTEVSTKKGAVVTKGSPLFTLESADDVKVDVEISKYDIGKIKEGQRASITVSGTSYDGRVTRINRFATGGTSDNAKVKVSVSVDDPGDSIFLGIQSDVTIYSDEKDNALTISREGLYSDDKGDYVYIISDGAIEKKYVVAGIVNDNNVEIIDGLTGSSVVIIDSVTDSEVGKKAISK